MLALTIDLHALTDHDLLALANGLAELDFHAISSAAAAEQEIQRRGLYD